VAEIDQIPRAVAPGPDRHGESPEGPPNLVAIAPKGNRPMGIDFPDSVVETIFDWRGGSAVSASLRCNPLFFICGESVCYSVRVPFRTARPGFRPAAAGLHPGLCEVVSIRLRRILPVLPLPALVVGCRGRAGSGELSLCGYLPQSVASIYFVFLCLLWPVLFRGGVEGLCVLGVLLFAFSAWYCFICGYLCHFFTIRGIRGLLLSPQKSYLGFSGSKSSAVSPTFVFTSRYW